MKTIESNPPCISVFDSHPLDLSLARPIDGENGRIKFAGDIEATLSNNEHMLALIGLTLQDPAASADFITALRVIIASREDERSHLFYEVYTRRDLLMCGGCTNFGGFGKTCKNRMDLIFHYLSSTYILDIVKIQISYSPQHEQVIDAIVRSSKGSLNLFG